MRICIVIPSAAFRDSAGMRIRYDRFRESLADPDVRIDSRTTEELLADKRLTHHAYVFCKTFDPAALLLARRIRNAGKVVGQDLFDDYFSQLDDPRLQRFREWLEAMAPATDYALCSTPRMVEVVRAAMPGVRVTSIDDPVMGYDPMAVGGLADAKVARAARSRIIEVAWFGIGDNPYFPVGLIDVASCEHELDRMRQAGWDVRLKIVTNRRAFQNGRAEVLRGLGLPFEVVEWSEAAEHEALSAATVALLPVNGQSFSRAKSLNRAITALNRGCQVLSLGFDLYDRLGDFIYRSTDELLADLAEGHCRLRGERTEQLTDLLSQVANPFEGSKAFVAEVRRAKDARAADAGEGSDDAGRGPICVVHGRSSKIGLHKAASRAGLSIGTFFCRTSWNFAVRFDLVNDELVMRVTEQVADRFALPLRPGSKPVTIHDLSFVEVDSEAFGVSRLPVHLPRDRSPIEELPVYSDVMQMVRDCCEKGLGSPDVLIADNSPLRPGRRPTRAPEILVPDDEPEMPAPSISPDRPGILRRLGQRGKLLRGTAESSAFTMVASSALFDAAWYLANNPDVAASGLDPIEHYLAHGWREGRDPSLRFSTRSYLKANADVARLGINPLLHYLEHGRTEGRRAPKPASRANAK